MRQQQHWRCYDGLRGGGDDDDLNPEDSMSDDAYHHHEDDEASKATMGQQQPRPQAQPWLQQQHRTPPQPWPQPQPRTQQQHHSLEDPGVSTGVISPSLRPLVSTPFSHFCYSCDELGCDQVFTTPPGLDAHKKTHETQVCPNCKKYFVNLTEYESHIRNAICTKAKEALRCPYCKQEFTTTWWCKHHVETAVCDDNPNRRPEQNQCPKCGAQIDNPGGLVGHVYLCKGTAVHKKLG